MEAIETKMPATKVKPFNVSTVPLWMIAGKEYESDSRRIAQTPDVETARDFWRMYRPEKLTVFEVLPNFRQLLPTDITLCLPSHEWYQEKSHAESIHGRQHSIRVAIYVEMLGQMGGLDDRQRKILAATAMLHDLGRVNDTVDLNHGVRSAEWWDRHRNVLESRGIYLSEQDKEIVKALCIHHEVSYSNVPKYPTQNAQESEEVHMLLKYFMAADALDRYRAINEEWWPKSKYFDHDPEIKALFVQMMPFAKYFTLATEYYRLARNKTIEEAIYDIGKVVGLFALDIDDTLRSRRE